MEMQKSSLVIPIIPYTAVQEVVCLALSVT